MFNETISAVLRYFKRAHAAEERALAEITEGLCPWTYDEFHEYWMTGCDKLFGLTNISPEEDGFQHCPFCGMRIVVEDEDED